MGTRAAFWVGDPRDLENREWLGCIAWDGYPNGVCKDLVLTKDVESFRRHIDVDFKTRDDFAHPEIHGWPYPWDDDIFLTDYTYAFFDGQVMCTHFHSGFKTLAWFLRESPDEEVAETEWEEYYAQDTLSESVPAPAKNQGLGSAPDSIIIVGAKPDDS